MLGSILLVMEFSEAVHIRRSRLVTFLPVGTSALSCYFAGDFLVFILARYSARDLS